MLMLFKMGAARSKLEDDKVIVLCQERKHFVREALDGRCALSASHNAYVLSLRENRFSSEEMLSSKCWLLGGTP